MENFGADNHRVGVPPTGVQRYVTETLSAPAAARSVADQGDERSQGDDSDQSKQVVLV
jgi:hypothetical protein